MGSNGGSILSQGAQMSAEGNAVLLATKDIVLDVAHNTERSDSSSRGKGWGFANNTSGLPFGTNNSRSEGSGQSDTITGTQLSVGGGVRMTGKIVTVSSGPVPEVIAPELGAYADSLGGLGVKTSCGNAIVRCAELRAANELMLANPRLKLGDVKFTGAVRPRNNQAVPLYDNPVYMEACLNGFTLMRISNVKLP
nr:hemagglutinin repeat-containing protein [Stenotrophomonas indicatrix]